MGYDDVAPHMGTFGRWHCKTYFILFLPVIAGAVHNMAGVFLATEPYFRCLLPHENPNNATLEIPADLGNASFPWNSKTGRWSQCERYDTGPEDTREILGENISSLLTTVKCDSFVYDKSNYVLTVATEWNLVCDYAWLRALADSLFMLIDVPAVIIFTGLSDKYGRKTMLLYGSIVQLLWGLLIAVSPNFPVYVVLRTLLGTTTSGLVLVSYVAAVEMVSSKNSLLAGLSISAAFSVGSALPAVLAYFTTNWRILQMTLNAPTIGLLVFWYLLSESPRWLLAEGRVGEARDAITKAASENGVELSRDVLQKLLDNENKTQQNVEKSSVFDLLKHAKIRNRSLILFIVWFVNSCSFFGLSWNSRNLGGNEYINFLLTAAAEIPAFIVILSTSNKCGRKKILFGGMMVSGTSSLLTFFVPTGSPWLMILFSTIGKFAVSTAHLTTLVFTTSQYPTAFRNIGTGVCSAGGRIGVAVAPYVILLSKTSAWLPFAVLGFSIILGGLLVLLLPETLNTRLPETIQEISRIKRTKKNTEPQLDQQLDILAATELLENRNEEISQK